MKKILYTLPLCLLAGNTLAAAESFEEQMARALRLSEASYKDEQQRQLSRNAPPSDDSSQGQIDRALRLSEASYKDEQQPQYRKELAQNILNRLIHVQSEIKNIRETAEYFMSNPPPLFYTLCYVLNAHNFKALKDGQLEWLKAYCGDKSLDFSVGVRLFNVLWNEFEQNACVTQLFSNISQIQQDIHQNSALRRLAESVMNEDKDDSLKKALQGELSKRIERLKEDSAQVESYLLQKSEIKPEKFLAESKIDLTGLYVGGGYSEEEAKPIIAQKPVRLPLNPKIEEFQKKISGLIETAGKVSSRESVRELGRRHVGAHYQDLTMNINELLMLMSAPEKFFVNSKDSLMSLYAPLQNMLDKIIRSQIEEIYDTVYRSRDDDQVTRERLKGISSYEYLLQVFCQVARTYALLQQNNEKAADEYLMNVFLTFHTQMEETSSGKGYVACSLGMTARLFQIHSLTLDKLVEHYNS